MTLCIAWVRRQGAAVELVVTTDSRLRSQGAMDQGQKIFRIERGDCCMAFCGDTHIAYPLFVQTATTINNHFKDRSGSTDFSQLTSRVQNVLNSLFDCWQLPKAEKVESVQGTMIFFGGWSWRSSRFTVGYFKMENDGVFNYHR